jgi:hypothetical protein
MFPPPSLFLSIFVTYPKEKMKEIFFFFFFAVEIFWVRLGYAGSSSPRIRVPKKYLVWVRLHFLSTRAS